MSNTEVVMNFIQAWNDRDWDAIDDAFTEDVVYHNIPMEPAVGPEAIWKIMDLVHGRCSQVDWKLHSIAESSDGSVLTERTDRYRIGRPRRHRRCRPPPEESP